MLLTKYFLNFPIMYRTSRLILFSFTVVLFLYSCGGSKPGMREEGLFYKGRKPYTGQVVDKYSLFLHRSETWFNKGIKVMEFHFDKNGDSLFSAIYYMDGKIKQEKYWSKGLSQRKIVYDKFGKIRREVLYDGFGYLDKTTHYTYNHYGHINEQKEFDKKNNLTFKTNYNEETKSLLIKYYKSGKLEHELTYTSEFLLEESFYRPDGKLRLRKVYNNNELIDEEIYYNEFGLISECLKYTYVQDNNGQIIETHIENLKGEISKLHR